jgi:hypothetical protein
LILLYCLVQLAAAVVCVLLGSTAFDGLTRTQWWQGVSGRATGLASSSPTTGRSPDYSRPRQRLRAQYPLLMVMVCYTLGGIALLLGA